MPGPAAGLAAGVAPTRQFPPPPRHGKPMLARRLGAILPPLSSDEVLEVSAIWSVAGLLPRHGELMTRRPFRAPHHTISVSGLIGGGGPPHPRSEEHTSELQSRLHLVCRLLLEKKKKEIHLA